MSYFSELHTMSEHPSTDTLGSVFSRNDSGITKSTTPAESNETPAIPSFSGLTDLIQRKIPSKTVVILVGLPGSGKSTICSQLSQYLNAQGHISLIYNAGNIRRSMSKESSDSEFFNPQNKEASDKREQYATICMTNMLEDLKENRVDVGFLDATNSTRARRQSMLGLMQNAGFEIPNIFMLDVSCTDVQLVNYNFTSKAFNQDYMGKDIATSISDFKKRAEHYSRVFEPLSFEELDQYTGVQLLSIQNGGTSCRTPWLDVGEVSSDVVIKSLATFVTSYYKLHGERYHAAVREFYSYAYETEN